jgi:MFS family permease
MFRNRLRFLILAWLFLVVCSPFSTGQPRRRRALIMKEFGLSPTQLGVVMAGFTIGYMLLSFPGGFLVQRFSSRLLLAGIIALWSLLTGLTGLAWSFASLMVIRVVFGMFEGPMFSANAHLVNLWMLPRERGTATAMWLAAIPVGIMLGNVASAAVVSAYGWRSVFYAFGLAGILVAVLSWVVVRDRPEDHPRISKQELENIKTSQRLHDGCDIADAEGSSMKELLRNPWVWVLSIVYFAAAMYLWGNLNWLPTYFLKARGSNLMNSGIYAAIPMVAATIGLFTMGWLSDRFGKDRSAWLVLNLFVAVPFTILGVKMPDMTAVCGAFPWPRSSVSVLRIIYTLPWRFRARRCGEGDGIMLAWSSWRASSPGHCRIRSAGDPVFRLRVLHLCRPGLCRRLPFAGDPGQGAGSPAAEIRCGITGCSGRKVLSRRV